MFLESPWSVIFPFVFEVMRPLIFRVQMEAATGPVGLEKINSNSGTEFEGCG